MGGWGELYPVLFWFSWIFFNFAKPLITFSYANPISVVSIEVVWCRKHSAFAGQHTPERNDVFAGQFSKRASLQVRESVTRRLWGSPGSDWATVSDVSSAGAQDAAPR